MKTSSLLLSFAITVHIFTFFQIFGTMRSQYIDIKICVWLYSSFLKQSSQIDIIINVLPCANAN